MLSIAAHGISVRNASKDLDRCFNLVTVKKIDRHQCLFQGCHRRARFDVFLRELFESDTPDNEQPLQFLNGVLSIIPEMRLRVRTSLWTCILVCQEHQPLLHRVEDDRFQLPLLFTPGGKVLIPVHDGNLVPFPDTACIGVRELYLPIFCGGDPWMWIIHHRSPVLRACNVIVRETDRVPDFVRRELPQPCQRHFLHGFWDRLPLFVRSEQSLRDQVILPHTQGAKRNMPLDDLPGARICDGGAVRPPARGAVDPLNNVVPHIHRVGSLRHHLHPEGVSVAGRFKCLAPPAGTVQQRGPDRLRRAAVEVVHDRLNRLADGSRGVLLLQPVAGDKPFGDRLVNRCRIVHVGNAEIPCAGIEDPGRIVAVR